MVPTRWRKQNCERLLKSYGDNTDNADLVFITDADDQDTYAGMNWQGAVNAVLDPPGPVVKKTNYVATTYGDSYDAVMYIGDDHVFSTPHWDTIMMRKLEEMGGTGMLYGDDKRRTDIPESIIISTDIIRTLGHFMEPSMSHYYVDNCWAELGRRSNLLRFMPEVVFEHFHYQNRNNVERDQTYSYAETMYGQPDREAYYHWLRNKMAPQAALLRRTFNPDIKWVTARF